MILFQLFLKCFKCKKYLQPTVTPVSSTENPSQMQEVKFICLIENKNFVCFINELNKYRNKYLKFKFMFVHININ